ncbi:MAG: hypothetical protein JNL85_15210 [Rubrivivax sp.]|nr:hypothetical protein [Rubrivivax sp.]
MRAALSTLPKQGVDATRPRRRRRGAFNLALLLAALGACSPALDWREVRPPGTALVALMPCRPNASVRPVSLAGQSVRLSMHACKAQDLTWALATADVGDPARVAAALAALRESMLANLEADVVGVEPATVRGASPGAQPARVRVAGRKPDGSTANGQFVLFAHGTQVFEAVVLGAAVPDAAAGTFFDSLQVGR